MYELNSLSLDQMHKVGGRGENIPGRENRIETM